MKYLSGNEVSKLPSNYMFHCSSLLSVSYVFLNLFRVLYETLSVISKQIIFYYTASQFGKEIPENTSVYLSYEVPILIGVENFEKS